MNNPQPPKLTPTLILATGLGLGLSPIAPGTVGTIWGIPLAWGISQLDIGWQLLTIFILFVIGVPLCTRAAQQLGRKDPGSVVWDEIASLPITFLFVPREMMNEPWVLLTGFVLHRVFDISKLPPTKQFERLPDGLGIMADDVMAAIYSCLSLHLVLAIVRHVVSGG